METRDFLAARQLLADLRASGCTVTVVHEELTIEGRYTDAQRAQIVTHKLELIALLGAAEASASVTAITPAPAPVPLAPPEVPPELRSWMTLGGTPPPPRRGLWVAGVYIPTAEQRRWMALRDAAVCQGRRFDLPYPSAE